MDYLSNLPGARVMRVSRETREALASLGAPEAVQSTMRRHNDALEKLSKL